MAQPTNNLMDRSRPTRRIRGSHDLFNFKLVTTAQVDITLPKLEIKSTNDEHDMKIEKVPTISVIAYNDDLICYVSRYNSKGVPDGDHSSVNC